MPESNIMNVFQERLSVRETTIKNFVMLQQVGRISSEYTPTRPGTSHCLPDLEKNPVVSAQWVAQMGKQRTRHTDSLSSTALTTSQLVLHIKGLFFVIYKATTALIGW